ncbi:MAG: FMN-binding negative transcriptional regulator, partial [Chloroflexota bacterium]
MYIPHQFLVADRAVLFDLMAQFNFATLVTTQDGVPVATHLPFLVKPDAGAHGTLVGHMARANAQWQTFAPDREALVIFQGHHAYISPSWYAEHPSVPTWNYAVVHAYGVPRIVDDYDAVVAILRALVARHEGGFETPWEMNLPDAYQRKMINGIVAFEIALTRLEGKFKLSQNRSAADRRGIVAALAQTEGTYQGVGRMM